MNETSAVGAAAATEAERFPEHPLRQAVLSELHARPFHRLDTPRLILHYAFMSTPETAARDREWLAARCQAEGVEPPRPDARHMVVEFGVATLRWETHGEFTTYSFDLAPPTRDGLPPSVPGNGEDTLPPMFGEGFVPPGPLLVACRLDLVRDDRPIGERLARFDQASLAVSFMVGGRALAATDFKTDEHGRTRILLVDTGMMALEQGSTVQRLLEIETYRTLALLGLLEAQRIGPEIIRIEMELAGLTERIRRVADLEENRALLADFTGLAADLERVTTPTAYRFGASRAYFEIIRARLEVLEEKSLDGQPTWTVFLNRRMLPALRTIQGTDTRREDLSVKLSRAAELLRTRVDVELERQNKTLLETMNRRGRMQLRLQQTVEGLSVAAVSYYVVGLIGYLARTVTFISDAIDPYLVTALSVPPVVLVIWLMVRRIRSGYDARRDGESEDE